MNYIKLNELAAQAMGWTKSEAHNGWVDADWVLRRWLDHWNPCGDLNDAMALIEKVAHIQEQYRWWEIAEVSGYKACLVDVNDREAYSVIKSTPALALVWCALWAAGISKQELQDAISA